MESEQPVQPFGGQIKLWRLGLTFWILGSCVQRNSSLDVIGKHFVRQVQITDPQILANCHWIAKSDNLIPAPVVKKTNLSRRGRFVSFLPFKVQL